MNKILFTKQINKGSAILISLFILIGISSAIIFAFSAPILASSQIARSAYQAKESYYTAEALTEDMIYRLNHGMDVSSTESLEIDGFEAEATLTDVSGGKEILTTGDSNGIERTIKTTLSAGIGAAFNYGMQVGTGGFTMHNQGRVVGNVYANGNITNGTITGTAIAANSAALFADQSNATPVTPTSSISFRNVATSTDIAQSFRLSTSSPINKIQLYIKKVGNPSSATVRIVANNNGSPGTTNLLSSNGTLNSALVTTNYGWVDVVFPSNPELNEDTVYWWVIDSSSQSSSNYYVLGANTGYVNGGAKLGNYASTWASTTPAGLDAYFSVYLGGLTSTISGTAVGGDAWAHTVSGGSVGGVKYCQVGSGCNTTRADPSPTAFPVSDANIAVWKEQAEEGGTISGIYTPPLNSTLGPKKINGNLIIANNFKISGTLWVTGNITTTNGVSVSLVSTYSTNEGVIVADGTIDVSNGAQFSGSGTSGSYVMLLSTNTSASAVSVSNNAGAVVLYASEGGVNFANNSSAKAAVGKMIYLGNATITYESGLVDMNFSSGPSGAWAIDTWQEVE